MTTHTATPTDMRINLWRGAGLTALAAVLFPRLNAVMYDHEKIWHLDREAAVLAPIVVLLALATFALVGPFAFRGGRNRPARAGLIAGIVAVLGVLAYFLSIPIIAGGLAVTLGVEGLRRAHEGRRTAANFAVVLGAVAVVAGAGLWLANF